MTKGNKTNQDFSVEFPKRFCWTQFLNRIGWRRRDAKRANPGEVYDSVVVRRGDRTHCFPLYLIDTNADTRTWCCRLAVTVADYVKLCNVVCNLEHWTHSAHSAHSTESATLNRNNLKCEQSVDVARFLKRAWLHTDDSSNTSRKVFAQMFDGCVRRNDDWPNQCDFFNGLILLGLNVVDIPALNRFKTNGRYVAVDESIAQTLWVENLERNCLQPIVQQLSNCANCANCGNLNNSGLVGDRVVFDESADIEMFLEHIPDSFVRPNYGGKERLRHDILKPLSKRQESVLAKHSECLIRVLDKNGNWLPYNTGHFGEFLASNNGALHGGIPPFAYRKYKFEGFSFELLNFMIDVIREFKWKQRCGEAQHSAEPERVIESMWLRHSDIRKGCNPRIDRVETERESRQSLRTQCRQITKNPSEELSITDAVDADRFDALDALDALDAPDALDALHAPNGLYAPNGLDSTCDKFNNCDENDTGEKSKQRQIVYSLSEIANDDAQVESFRYLSDDEVQSIAFNCVDDSSLSLGQKVELLNFIAASRRNDARDCTLLAPGFLGDRASRASRESRAHSESDASLQTNTTLGAFERIETANFDTLANVTLFFSCPNGVLPSIVLVDKSSQLTAWV